MIGGRSNPLTTKIALRAGALCSLKNKVSVESTVTKTIERAIRREHSGLDYQKMRESQGTVTMYRASLRDFLSRVYGHEITNGDVELLAKLYFTENRQYQEDMENYDLGYRKSVAEALRIANSYSGRSLQQVSYCKDS